MQGPRGERRFHMAVGLRVLRQHLQARTGADAVVGQRQHDAARVGVVGDLVAGVVPESAAHCRRIGGLGREAVRVRPVAAVLVSDRRGVIAPTNDPDGARMPARPSRKDAFEPSGHVRQPPAGSAWRNAVPSAWTWPPSWPRGSGPPRSAPSGCCSTLPESPVALAGALAFSRIVCSRSFSPPMSASSRLWQRALPHPNGERESAPATGLLTRRLGEMTEEGGKTAKWVLPVELGHEVEHRRCSQRRLAPPRSSSSECGPI